VDSGYRIESTVIDTPDVTAWLMSGGEIGGIDVAGLTVLVVRPGPVVIVDEQATPQQVQVVRDLFAERGSGFYLAPVTVRSRRLSVSIPEQRIECHLTLPEGEPRRSQ
jgi:hypothetical protein